MIKINKVYNQKDFKETAYITAIKIDLAHKTLSAYKEKYYKTSTFHMTKEQKQFE
ncbi:hypothetical protein J6Q66_01370 [bacterium]|nr:hypothetical protein [bacterium]